MSQQESLFQEPGAAGQPASAADRPAGPFSVKPSAEPDPAASLRAAERQVSNLLILLLVISGTLTIYLLQQVRYARADMAAIQLQAQQLEEARQVINAYNEKNVPVMRQFIEQLGEYSKTHPDVLPILAKYGLVQRAPSPGSPPAQKP
ncbi:MAG: hypothetical protein MUE94_08530 [Verrucomicrobia bacterium]|jgi:hypothetical protein|nr:hypothetical protein [Verrucomicrobiota bacterium]